MPLRKHLICLVVALQSLFAAAPALAHASLVSAHPGKGTVMAKAPGHVQLRFNEPVSPISLRLIDAAGTTHDLAIQSDGEAVEGTLPTDLPEGAQVLSYRVVSADGHPVGASFVFHIGHQGAAPAAPAPAGGRGAALWLDGALVLNLLLAGIGLSAFLAFCAPESLRAAPRRAVRIWLGLGTASLIAALALQGLDLLDLPPASLFSAGPWVAALASPLAITVAGEMLAMGLAAAAIVVPNLAASRLLAGLALLSAGLGRAASGHAASASLLSRPTVALHVMTAGLWFGALPGLFWLARGNRAGLLPALRRFSTLAVVTVALLAASGLGLAVTQLDAPSDLLTSAYGRLLLAKLILVAVLLSIAGWNRQIVTPLLLDEAHPGAQERARIWLVRTVALEMALMAAILGLVAGWRLTPPPRALAAATKSLEMLHLHGDRMMAMVQFEPGRPGANSVRIDLLGPDFEAFNAQEVELVLSATDLGIERSTAKATRAPDGSWRIERLFVPVPGTWTVGVGALVSDFEKITLEGPSRFPP